MTAASHACPGCEKMHCGDFDHCKACRDRIRSEMTVPKEGAHAEALACARSLYLQCEGKRDDRPTPPNRLARIAEEIDNATIPVLATADALSDVTEDDATAETFTVRSEHGASARVRLSVIEDLRKSAERLQSLSRELRGLPKPARRPDEHDRDKGREDARDEKIAQLRGEP